MDYTVVEMTDEELEQERVVFGGLAESVRDLADASLRTTVSAEVVTEVQAEIERLTARLREEQIPGAFGVEPELAGDRPRPRQRGRRAAQPDRRTARRSQHSDEGRAWSSFHLGALYEGPPGMVHGGVVALVLDQVLGEAAAAGGSPGDDRHAARCATCRRPRSATARPRRGSTASRG